MIELSGLYLERGLSGRAEDRLVSEVRAGVHCRKFARTEIVLSERESNPKAKTQQTDK
jgi:hypothetical protein